MKKIYALYILLAVMAAVAGILTEHLSFAGKAGIHFVYKNYHFLTVWWQSALACFVFYVFTGIIAFLISRIKNVKLRKQLLFLLLLLLAAGVVAMFYDFRHTLSHRILGERFHLGLYLYLLGAMLPVSYYLVRPVQHHRMP